MIGALISMGCPLRTLLRLAGGDLNAVAGLVGLACGIGAGVFFLQKGFSLGRAYALPKAEGFLFPAANILLLIPAVAVPSVFITSATGPGSMRAPVLLSAAAGLVISVVSQRMRICFVGAARDFILFKQYGMLLCFAALFVVALAGNILTGRFVLGFENQPFAHTDLLWNFFGLLLAGFASVLLGGCPLRQLVMAGSGNADSAVTVLGFLTGVALAYNFNLASTVSGPTVGGKIAFVACLIFVSVIAAANVKKISGNAA